MSKQEVSRLVAALGNVNHLRGFRLLVEVLMMVSEEPMKLQTLASVYEGVGEKYGIDAGQVEKNIRYLIKKIDFGQQKVQTNAQFIFRMAEQIRLEEGKDEKRG